MYLIGKLDEIRKKYQRDDLLLTGMGIEAGEMTEEQREEDIKTYHVFVKPEDEFNDLSSQFVTSD